MKKISEQKKDIKDVLAVAGLVAFVGAFVVAPIAGAIVITAGEAIASHKKARNAIVAEQKMLRNHFDATTVKMLNVSSDSIDRWLENGNYDSTANEYGY